MSTETRLDRLSALVSRFALFVEPVDRSDANLLILQCADCRAPHRLHFSPNGPHSACDLTDDIAVFTARADWGGVGNPFISALPTHLDLDIHQDKEMQSLAALIVAESKQRRCGSGSVINRLGEVLLVRLLRSQLSTGETQVGLLGGLADPRLSVAIVAMHEQPGRRWRIDDLATEAGLSTSRFADHFTRTVGQTPMAYLRNWRMVLARQDVVQGDRIQSVASRYGYASTEALSRAFRRHFGQSPVTLRQRPGQAAL